MGFMKVGKAIGKVLDEMKIARNSEQGMYMAEQMSQAMGGQGRAIADVRQLGQDALSSFKTAEAEFGSNAERVSRYGTFENSLRSEREAISHKVLEGHQKNLDNDITRYGELQKQRSQLVGEENLRDFNDQYGQELQQLSENIKNNPLTRAKNILKSRAETARAQQEALKNTEQAVKDSQNVDMQELVKRSNEHEEDVAALGSKNIGTGDKNQFPTKPNAINNVAEAEKTGGTTTEATKASEKVPSAFEKFESDVKTGEASKGWFGGPKTAETKVARAKANYKSVKKGAEGLTGEKLEKYLAEQGERLGTKFEGSNWAEREKSYYDNLSRDPSFNDYMIGNQVYGKAAGVGVAALTASAVMGDGRRSNAQLYSSPF